MAFDGALRFLDERALLDDLAAANDQPRHCRARATQQGCGGGGVGAFPDCLWSACGGVLRGGRGRLGAAGEPGLVEGSRPVRGVGALAVADGPAAR